MMLSVPSLLDCWQVRDLARFRRVCQPNERSAQKSRSPASLSNSLTGLVPGPCSPAEVNRRDALGRTVLHLLASSDPNLSGEYLQLLLSHPSVHINLQDLESGYTALHRALYYGYLSTAITLLKRSDIDLSIRDHEGLTPFDLYNATVPGTSPTSLDSRHGMELFVWGANRNYTLGVKHAKDSSLPECVKLRRDPLASSSSHSESQFKTEPGSRFDHWRIRDIAMSRWHTVILSFERRANVYVCGVGAHGRLGRMPSTVATFQRLADFSEQAVAVAVGPDHSVLVTSEGVVYTYGSNRMAQLGYTIEEGVGTTASSSGTVRSSSQAANMHGTSIGSNGTELDVQVTPRRVQGVLKRESVLGAAASRLHTAVFTADALYTWGTNNGQLGYDHQAAPIQTQPRRVTAIDKPVHQVAVTEFATACLLTSWDVVVFHGDAHFRVTFPVPRPMNDLSVFRPRQTQPKPTVKKLSCSGTTFAALAESGDLFTFTLEHPTGLRSISNSKPAQPRPQLVWAVRRKFSAVRDVAIGQDGALILCTASGHVYVRGIRPDASSSKAAANRAQKFQLVPYLQRVVRVQTNDSGSFAALQAPASLKEIYLPNASLVTDLRSLLPHLGSSRTSASAQPESQNGPTLTHNDPDHAPRRLSESSSSEEDEDQDSRDRDRYVNRAHTLLRNADAWRPRLGYPMRELAQEFLANGCDALLVIEQGSVAVPVHRTMLDVRIPILRTAANKRDNEDTNSQTSGIKVTYQSGIYQVFFPNLSLLGALFFLEYIYTDDISPVWTADLGVALADVCRDLRLSCTSIRPEVKNLADTLRLDALSKALSHHVWRAPEMRLSSELATLFQLIISDGPDGEAYVGSNTDVVLHLADRDIRCHSLFLRRSPMLYALFEWHRQRGDTGVIDVDLRHQRWDVVRIGLHFLYTDADQSIFQNIDQDLTSDQFIDWVLDVLQLGDELLIRPLQLICLKLLRRRIKPSNVAALLSDANRYNSPELSDVCMDYITRNMETLLTLQSLNELALPDLVILENYVQQRQDQHLARTVASDRLFALTLKHQAYVDSLDIPKPSLNMACLKVQRRSNTPSLRTLPRMKSDSNTNTPPSTADRSADDSLQFTMDDVDETLSWQTIGKPRLKAAPASSPRRVPTDDRLVPDHLSSSTQAASSRLSTTRSSPTPFLNAENQANQGWMSSASASTRSTGTNFAASNRSSFSASPKDSVSVETQEALNRLPIVSRGSQKERKKRGPVPDSLPQTPAPVWGRSARAPAASVSADARASFATPSPRPSPSLGPKSSNLNARSEIWYPASYGTTPQSSAGARSPAPLSVSPPSVSFASIQQEQRKDSLMEMAKMQTPSSFAQIQHEERMANERQRREQQEAEAFERWFEQESLRVQQEQQQHTNRRNPSSSQAQRHGRKNKRNNKSNSNLSKTKLSNPAEARIDDT